MQNIKLTPILFISFFFSFLCLSVNLFSQTDTPCSAGVVFATPITSGATCNFQAGTSVGSNQQTTTANGGTPSCGSMGPDVWFSFTAPTTASYQINTQMGTMTDGVMSLYTGICGAWTQLDCNDDAIGLAPQITHSLTSGTTYLIRVWNYGGGTGTFNICVQQLTALPLNLLSFTGQRAGNKHMLNWETAMEENTSHFEIEKSMDGINFNFLTQVAAVGSGANSYTATDAQLQAGPNYYRLKSVDKDDSYTYSKIILLQVAANSIDKLLQVYPSFAKNQIQVIPNNATISGNAVINIYGMQGQKMKSITTSGQQLTTIDISGYTAGTYIVEFVCADKMLRTKFIKID